MTIGEIIQSVPDAVKWLFGTVTTGLALIGTVRSMRKKRIDTTNELVEKYKKAWIKANVELLNKAESHTMQRRLLIEMKAECPECCTEAEVRTGITLESLKMKY